MEAIQILIYLINSNSLCLPRIITSSGPQPHDFFFSFENILILQVIRNTNIASDHTNTSASTQLHPDTKPGNNTPGIYYYMGIIFFIFCIK